MVIMDKTSTKAANSDMSKERTSRIGDSNPGSQIPNPDSRTSQKTNGHLIHLKDLPEWAQDNPYILSYHRPISFSYRICLTSLTYIHNQTVNIYSHLLFLFPILYLILRATLALTGLEEPSTSPRREDVVVFAIFFAGGIACMAFSTCYHTLMCHSEAVAQKCRQLDYAGIACLIWSSFVPTIYYTFTCEVEMMRKFLLTFTGIAVLLVAFLLSPLVRKPWAGPMIAPLFVIFAASGVAPLGKGILLYGWAGMEEMVGIKWVLAQGGMYLLGLVPFVFQWPESSRPGRYDVLGASHQLFHVAVVLAASIHYVGLLRAYGFQHSHAQFAICPMLETWKGNVLLQPGVLGKVIRSAL